MGKELLIRALRGVRVERTPWLPHIGTHAAQLLEVSAERYLQDAELLACGAVLCADRYHCDGIPLLDDPQMEAISLGCVAHWSEQGPPSIVSSPLYGLPAEQVAAQLPPLPDETTGRWPTVIAAGTRAKPELERHDVALVGIAAGPCTLAYQLRGMALFRDLFRHPECAVRVFAYAGQVSALFEETEDPTADVQRCIAEGKRFPGYVFGLGGPLTRHISMSRLEAMVAAFLFRRGTSG